MIRRGVRRILYTPWPQRWLVDVVALAMATAILPRIGEGLHVHSAQGFALVLVASTAVLLAASWALLPPPPSSGPRGRGEAEPEGDRSMTTSSLCPPDLISSSTPSSPSVSLKSLR